MKTNRSFLATIALTLVLAPSAFAQAQNTTTPSSPLEGLQIQAGILSNLKGKHDASFYQKFTYKGQMLTERGKPFQNADTTHQFLPAAQGQNANTPGLQLDLTQGAGTANSDILNAFGINAFPLPKLDLYPFTSIARLAGTLDGKQVNAAFGFETPSLHPVRGLSNWVILGTNIEGRFVDDQIGKDTTVGLATYRAFFGSAAFGRFRRLPFTREDLYKAAPDKAALLRYAETPPPTTGNADLDKFLNNLANSLEPLPGMTPPPIETPEQLRAFLSDRYDRLAGGYSLEPTRALWLESDGWYTFAGDPQGQRLKGLLAVVATLYGNFRDKSRSSLQVRYETGFDRAEPRVRLNRVMVNLGLNF